MNQRKDKRRINQMQKSLGFGKFCIDCRQHPVRVTSTEFYPYSRWGGDSINGKSLLDETSSACSLRHCNPMPITETVANEMVRFWKENGWYAYLWKYIYSGLSDKEKEETKQWYIDWKFSAPEPP